MAAARSCCATETRGNRSATHGTPGLGKGTPVFKLYGEMLHGDMCSTYCLTSVP